MKNKTTWIIVGIVLAVIILIVGIFAGANNKAIFLEEQINGAQANINVAEKRRVDLVYNLVDAVQAYQDYEGKTLEAITAARSSVSNGDIDEADVDADILLARIEGNEDVCLLKARVLKAKGDAANAENMYNKVLEANPFCIEAFAERAIVRRQQGNEDGAKDDEATAEEMRASVPQDDEGIEQKIKEKMQQADPYKVFNND